MKTNFIGILIVAMLYASNSYSDSNFLISPEEAALEDSPIDLLTDISPTKSLIQEGPRVIFNTPKPDGVYEAPVDVSMAFETDNDAEIDLESIRIKYMKLGGINVTKRFKKYISKQGMQIKEAKLPSGKHTFRFELADTLGRKSKYLISFRVR